MRRIILFLFAVFVVTAWTLPSFAAETTFSGTWRVRAFALDNSDFDDDTADQSSYIDQRFRLGVNSRASDDFGGFLEIQAGNMTWGQGIDTVTSTTTSDCTNNNDVSTCTYTTTSSKTDSVSLNQAYLDFNVQNVNIKVGKQDFGVPGDIFNLVLIETFDAIVVSTQVGPATVYGAFVKLNECDKDGGAGLACEALIEDVLDLDPGDLAGLYDGGVNDDDVNVYVLGGQFSPTKGVSAGAFWVAAKENLTQTDWHWIGANGSFNAGPVGIDVEGVVLTGSIDQPAPLDFDYSGWALVGDVGFSPNEQVGIGLLAGVSSGDDGTDTDVDTFFGLAPSFNQTDILLDGGDGGNGGATVAGIRTGQMSNLTIIKPYVTFKPMDQLTLRAQWAWMKLTEVPSGWDDEIGSELNLQADYTIHSASKLGLRVQANWFFPDDAFTGGSGQPDDAVSEYYARLQYEF